ncbi:hypothetical protein OG799_03740 [Micromonospora sp. NBC_00898]|uniref:hypothetical protein n=1 Tax=Micromonospora sp. NBC_00898 TaxID=2975981 RepID=UPI00386525C1|nr:hypothetical protein OG799_03740 [Micromonospora sp. NBC_00898]
MTEEVRGLAVAFMAELRPLLPEETEFDLRDVAGVPRSADLWVYGRDVDVCVSFVQDGNEARLLIDRRVVDSIDTTDAIVVVADAVGSRGETDPATAPYDNGPRPGVPFDRASVRQAFVSFAARLARQGCVSEFQLKGEEAVRLVLCREGDGVLVTVSMTGTGEVFLLNLMNSYDAQRTAYDDAARWEALGDLLAIAEQFLRGNYVEEVHERRGKLVGGRIRFTQLANRSLVNPRGVRGALQRMAGYDTRVVRW